MFARCTVEWGLEIFSGWNADLFFLSRQMPACSNLSGLDVLLIQPLFIPPGIDVPLHSLKPLSSYKKTWLAHNYYKTLSQSSNWVIWQKRFHIVERKKTAGNRFFKDISGRFPASCTRQHLPALSLLYCRYIKCGALHLSLPWIMLWLKRSFHSLGSLVLTHWD